MKKKIREINSLVTCLVKMFLSRNFCEKSMRENFRDFHTVVRTEKYEIGLAGGPISMKCEPQKKQPLT